MPRNLIILKSFSLGLIVPIRAIEVFFGFFLSFVISVWSYYFPCFIDYLVYI
jgi:hypothetical protein